MAVVFLEAVLMEVVVRVAKQLRNTVVFLKLVPADNAIVSLGEFPGIKFVRSDMALEIFFVKHSI